MLQADIDATLVSAKSLPDLFRTRASSQPENIVISGEGMTLSYAQVDRWSNAIGNTLLSAGIAAGDAVGIRLTDLAYAQVAAIGILKIGAAYVPLDPSYPAHRLSGIAGDCQLKAMVSNTQIPPGPPVIWIEPGEGDESPIDLRVDPHSVAYIMYTSGSTGAPKGCMVTHSNVLALLRSTHQLFSLERCSRVALFHPFIFDASVFEFWLAIAAACTAVPVPAVARCVPDELIRVLAAKEVNFISQVPVSFHALSAAYMRAGRPELYLNVVVLGGDRIDLAIIAEFLNNYRGRDGAPRLFNLYGPTEATCVSTYHEITPGNTEGDLGQPIGKPLPHVHVVVANEALQPVATGEAGQLLIAGEGVARGYVGDDEFTRAKFRWLTIRGSSRLFYLSGDLVRLHPGDELEYISRSDRQVKIRGVRIELGEVESHARLAAEVEDAAACVVKRQTGEFLVLCCVPKNRRADGGEFVSSLRRHLRGVLPRHFLPDRMICVDALPLTASGKLDRAEVARLGFAGSS